MPRFTKLTPNLVVTSVERSLAFYVDTLGFSRGMTTLFVEMQGVDALHDTLKSRVKIVTPIVTQFYGMREFAIEDLTGTSLRSRNAYHDKHASSTFVSSAWIAVC